MLKYFVLPFLYKGIRRVSLRDDLPVTNYDDWTPYSTFEIEKIYKKNLNREFVCHSSVHELRYDEEWELVDVLKHINMINNLREGITLIWDEGTFFIPELMAYQNTR